LCKVILKTIFYFRQFLKQNNFVYTVIEIPKLTVLVIKRISGMPILSSNSLKYIYHMCRCRGMRGIIRVGVESKGLWEQGS
jgi:uncharacterized protein YqhQ